jgi:hypothetical protein
LDMVTVLLAAVVVVAAGSIGIALVVADLQA